VGEGGKNAERNFSLILQTHQHHDHQSECFLRVDDTFKEFLFLFFVWWENLVKNIERKFMSEIKEKKIYMKFLIR
jgi:hypothetical protein